MLHTTVSYNHYCKFMHIFAPVQRTLEAINFSHITLPNVERFLKFFQNRLSSKFVVMFKVKSHHAKITVLHYIVMYC